LIKTIEPEIISGKYGTVLRLTSGTSTVVPSTLITSEPATATPQRKEICDGHSQTYGAAGIRAALKNKPQIKPSDFYCNSFTVGYSANASSRLMISAIAL